MPARCDSTRVFAADRIAIPLTLFGFEGSKLQADLHQVAQGAGGGLPGGKLRLMCGCELSLGRIHNARHMPDQRTGKVAETEFLGRLYELAE